MWKTVISPLESVGVPFDTTPLAVITALHVFHCIKDASHLDVVDWIHHGSVILLCALTLLSTARPAGPLCNFCLFFICGFPGGVDYYLLVFRKKKWIQSRTEKYINMYLHQWIRCPGLIIYCTIAYIANAQNPVVSDALTCLFILPVMFNALYFSHRVILNYGRCHQK